MLTSRHSPLYHIRASLYTIVLYGMLMGTQTAIAQPQLANVGHRAYYTQLDLASSPFRADDNYLDKHDIVYKSPTILEAEGLPLGNGDLGGMVWNHDNGIEIQINKNDLWTTPVESEEGKSILRHAARLKIDFGIPVYSWIHLKDFTGRLSLANGQVSYDAASPFADSKIDTWLATGRNVWVVECENRFDQTTIGAGSTATVTLERIGSRAFAGWYGGWFPKDPRASLGQTEVKASASDIVLSEKGDGLDFVVVCRVLEANKPAQVINANRGVLQADAGKVTVLVSVVTSKESPNPELTAKALLDEVELETVGKIKQEKDEWYARFWSNSFIKIGHDYLENIYYLRRYLMAAGSQGQYPITFNGGLWRWNRDVMNWVTPHHWNTQQQYWGIGAQNDYPLMRPYLDTYFKMIPYAQDAAKRKGAVRDAIWMSEAHDFDGRQVSEQWNDMKYNYSVAGQVAGLFWDYYLFTSDKRYLRDTAFVFMEKALNFYLDKLEWNEKEQIYELHSSLYESSSIEKVKNSESDRNVLEALLNNCINAAAILNQDSDDVRHWKFVLQHLWPRVFEEVIDCGETIAPATEYFTERRYSPYEWAIGGTIAFPAGIIGIDQRYERVGRAVANFVKCRDVVNAHHPVSIIAARMGMGNDALTYLVNGVKAHQMYPQGFMTNVTGYPDNIYDLESVHDLLGGHKIRSQAFFQAGMEPISNYATSINEMLLQSNEGKIRIFPAIPDEWRDSTLAFTLLARGGFLVSTIAQHDAIPDQVGIKSLSGNICRLQHPWPEAEATVYRRTDRGFRRVKTNRIGDVISFETSEGNEYVICRSTDQPSPTKAKLEGRRNEGPKSLGARMLGRASGWNEGFIN